MRGDAASGGSGRSWATAYNDLQLALARARRGCGNTIWVAKGIYCPGPIPTDVFDIPASVSVHGGLAGNESSLAGRDFKTNRTILSGEIAPGVILPNFLDGYQVTSDLRNLNVVTMGGGSLLDGCVVEGAGQYGVEVGGSSSCNIQKCSIMNNGQSGIHSDGSATIDKCVVEDNEQYGIAANGSAVTITGSVIRNNHFDGILAGSSTTMIRNCVVSHNGLASEWGWPRYFGIHLDNATDATVANCTIADNNDIGLYHTGNYAPTVCSCILWYNKKGGEPDWPQIEGIPAANVTYSCMSDAVVPNSAGNINSQPGFASLDPNYADYFHLAGGSPCVNTGDPCTALYIGQYDVDGDPRAGDGHVDIGADEQTCTERIFNVADFNGDGIVDTADLMIFGEAWLSHDPSVNWNPRVNLAPVAVRDTVIDFKDYAEFAKA